MIIRREGSLILRKVNFRKMNKQGGSPIAILLLTIGIIMVMIGTWQIFLVRQGDLVVNLQSAQLMEAINARQAIIDAHIFWIMEDVKNQMTNSDSKQEFIDLFKKEIKERDLKNAYGEFVFIENQLIEENIEIDTYEMKLKLKMKVGYAGSDGKREVARVLRVYEKKFVVER